MASKRRISYQWRLFFPMIALLWVTIGTLVYFRYKSEKEIRTEQLNDDLRLINSRVIMAYESDIDIEPFMRFISKYYENSEFNGIRMSVYDAVGNLLYCIGAPIPREIDGEITSELNEATVNGAGTNLRRDSTDKDKAYYFFGARRSSDGKIFVHTAMPYTSAIKQTLAVSNDTWIVLVAVLIATTLISYFSTRYLGKNIKLLHMFANRAAKGEPLGREYGFPHDELGDISREIVKIYRERLAATERSEREHKIAIRATEDKIKTTKELTNNINHELKTPVGVIKGYLDTIAEHPEMDEASRTRFIQKAQEHMTRMCNMLNDLSSINRLEDGASGVMKEKVDFHEIVANIKTELEIVKIGDLKFEYDMPPGIYINGNYNLLYAMVMNLIRNANFHSHGTVCGIKLIRENNHEYTFSFYDDGTGVSEEHLPHLFDRFYRIDKGRSRKMGGTGLGLPIVKNTINVQGGAIRVQNRQPHGLEFIFTLIKWSAQSN
ncbi:MAG: HAMP domain-containing histidine kinase [Muribaculum sp.]|nr:HAMP domain-containing histidine kinase [Muribaculum sp.]